METRRDMRLHEKNLSCVCQHVSHKTMYVFFQCLLSTVTEFLPPPAIFKSKGNHMRRLVLS